MAAKTATKTAVTAAAPAATPRRASDTASYALLSLAAKAVAAADAAAEERKAMALVLSVGTPTPTSFADMVIRITSMTETAGVYSIALSHLTDPAPVANGFTGRLARLARIANKAVRNLASSGAAASSCQATNSLVNAKTRAAADAWVHVLETAEDWSVVDNTDDFYEMAPAEKDLVAAAVEAAATAVKFTNLGFRIWTALSGN